MMGKGYNKSKQGLKGNNFYNRQINRIIFILLTLVFVLIIKVINHNKTNNIIKIIDRNINYEFSWKQDGEKIMEYMKKIMGNTIESIETFNMGK